MRRAPIIFAAAGTAAALAGLAAYRRVVRPWYESWGGDPADENRLLPGDELVATPTAGDTRGIEIAAPAAAIWPWLVQMGLGRGGWYSYDALDMKGRSAEAIVPEWQSIAAGDTLPAWPGGGFEVAQIEPEHALVLYLDDKIVAAAERLAADPPGGLSVEFTVERDAGPAHARGRGRDLHIPHHVRLHLSLGGHAAKQDVYAASVRAAVADLVHCAATGDVPVSNGRTAADAVATARAATTAARTGQTITLDDLGAPSS